MGLLIWLEETGLAEWVRSSIPGYPAMIAAHAIGMAVMVGLALALDLRLLGNFAEIPYSALQRAGVFDEAGEETLYDSLDSALAAAREHVETLRILETR